MLVAGNENHADLYSQSTLRFVRRIETSSRVICAVGGRNLAFLSVVSKQILIYSLKRAENWTLIRKMDTTHPATAMDIVNDRMLAYGLGDEGYGSITFKPDQDGQIIFTK